MRVVKDGSIVEDGHLQQLLDEAHSLDCQMLQAMRGTITEVLAREEVSSQYAA